MSVHVCPEHLHSAQQYFVERVTDEGNRCVADLPNAVREVEIPEGTFTEILAFWNDGRCACLEMSGGIIVGDDILKPDNVKVIEPPHETSEVWL